MKKALTVANVINQKVTTIDFETINNDLYQAFGNPQNKGIVFIWGGSGSGKSSLAFDWTKALCQSGLKAIWNEREEDLDSLEFIDRIRLKRMQDVNSNLLYANYDFDEMNDYLDKRNSPEVIVINSATYFFESLDKYFEFTKKYKGNKIIVITGMAKGNNPYTELETRIMYDANKKIFSSVYLAACKGRTIGPNGGLYIIWQEGYEKARGSENNK